MRTDLTISGRRPHNLIKGWIAAHTAAATVQTCPLVTAARDGVPGNRHVNRYLRKGYRRACLCPIRHRRAARLRRASLGGREVVEQSPRHAFAEVPSVMIL